MLRYSIYAHGQGFRRAGLELVRKIHTGFSMTHGFERITVKERLIEAPPGDIVQSEWQPVAGPANPLLVAMGPLPFRGDVVAVLRELGAPIKSIPLLCSWLTGPMFVIGEGEPITYRLRLTVDGRSVDEAEMKVARRVG